VDRKRNLNTGGGRRQPAIGSQGWQDLKAIFFWSQLRLMEGVAGQEGYSSEDLLGCGLETVSNKGGGLWDGM
jgi:hypothetical protein